MNLFNRGELAASYIFYGAYTLFSTKFTNKQVNRIRWVCYLFRHTVFSSLINTSCQLSLVKVGLLIFFPFYLWVFWDN